LGDLKKKSVDGIFWSLFEKYGIQFVKLILGIILARLLTPADYGLIGMITVFFVIANVFIDSGLGLAYIQKENSTRTDASTIFYFNLALSIVLYFILWISANTIALYYNEPRLVDLLRVMGVILIINSFSIIQIAQLTKEVDFKKKSLILIVSALISGLAGIVAALNGFKVWSLVIQGVANSFIRTIGLWVFYKWRPLLLFSVRSLKSLFSFSFWTLLTNLFSTFFQNFYTLVIGKYFPAAELGFYTKAKQFQSLVSRQSSHAIGSVSFPVFSKLQDDKTQLKKAVKKFNQYTLFFVAPISMVLLVVAKPLFLILLTMKWLPMVPYFQLLMVVGVFYPLHMTNVQVLTAQGLVNLTFKLEVIKNILRVLNIAILYPYGVFYIILGEIGLSFIALVINTFYTKKYLKYGVIAQLNDVKEIFITVILLTFLGFYISNFFTNNFLQVIVVSFLLMSSYIVLMYVFNKSLLLDNILLIRRKILKK